MTSCCYIIIIFILKKKRKLNTFGSIEHYCFLGTCFLALVSLNFKDISTELLGISRALLNPPAFSQSVCCPGNAPPTGYLPGELLFVLKPVSCAKTISSKNLSPISRDFLFHLLRIYFEYVTTVTVIMLNTNRLLAFLFLCWFA